MKCEGEAIIRQEIDDLPIVFSLVNIDSNNAADTSQIDQFLSEISEKVGSLDHEIDKLTNHADGVDYSIAVASGILSGLIDSFYVGEINWNQAKADSHKFFNDVIMKKANMLGYDGNRLDGAIKKLEDTYKLPSDNIWSGKEISSTKYHHLDDLAHHPTPLGLLANIVTTLFRVGIFNSKDGSWHFPFAPTDFKTIAKIWGPILLTALLHWMVSVAEKKYTEEQQKEIPKPIRCLLRLIASAPAIVEFVVIVDRWVGHLMSDMCGSKSSADGGMGIPGVFLSLLSEIASLPGLNMTPLPKLIHQWYKSGFDMRIEGAVLRISGKQAVPVLLNEFFVRMFYFIRRLVPEIRNHGTNWGAYNWENTVPFSNRTIVRMLTIAHGTFVAFDLADAAIRTAGSGEYADPTSFFARMALKVNFVGFGRFTVAVFSDVIMGIKRYNRVNERMDLYSKMLNFYGAKIYYKDADMWISAENAEIATLHACDSAKNAAVFFAETFSEIKENLNGISKSVSRIEMKNPGLTKELADLLEE